MSETEVRLTDAVRHFWRTRGIQRHKQGKKSGVKDKGARSAVTGGAQMDGFIGLVAELLIEAGVAPGAVFKKKNVEVPGFFRPSKEWDLLVITDGHLQAALEFKSQVGSFGNNYNNRTEEALGNATDLWTAYREGAFEPSPRPWLGYLMLLQEAPGSLSPVGVSEPHFKVLSEFRGASYAKRYELLCLKLVRERLYDAACFLLSDEKGGSTGRYREPTAELAFGTFMASLTGRVNARFKA